jgi:acyl dehydratase
MTDVDQLAARAGEDLGASGWVTVCQERVDAFAAVTGDRQWIHTDPERASATALGGTIAHGYLTLALAPALLAEVLPLDAFPMAINYGLDRLRFPEPLPVGDDVRLRARLDAVEPRPGGAELRVELVFERRGGRRPVCVAQAIYRVFTERPS